MSNSSRDLKIKALEVKIADLEKRLKELEEFREGLRRIGLKRSLQPKLRQEKE